MTTRIKDLAVSDNGFVFDPYSGSGFTTNAVGLHIIRRLQANASRSAILQSLDERFEGLTETLDRDLDDFLLVLRQQKLVDPDFRL